MVVDKFSPHTVGGRIVSLRESRNMSQGELAVALNISPSALRNLEHNDSQPRLSNLEKLSDIFDVSIDYIVRGVMSNGDNLGTFRETGLNDTSIAFLGEQIEIGRECGGLNDYIAALNAIISGGFPALVWGLKTLNDELAGIDGEISCILCNTPKPKNIVEEMQMSNELSPLRERRDLLKLRYLRLVEKAFDNLIDKGADE